MNRKIKLYFTLLFLVILIVYGLTAFLSWSLTPNYWSTEAKGTFAGIIAIVALMLAPAVDMSDW